MTPDGPKSFFLRRGAPTFEFVFFISSGNDVSGQRDLFNDMVRTTNNQFRVRRDDSKPFTLEVDRWEHDAGRRTTEMNEEFVRRARNSHATVVLLSDEIRSGTKEEIEGVLDKTDVQVSVIWMDQPGTTRKYARLKKYLREKEGKLAYVRTGPPGSNEAICAMLDVIAASLADLTHSDRREELFHESR